MTRGRPPSLGIGGSDLPTLTQRSHRGSGDGMSAQENGRNTGDPGRWVRDPTGRPRGTGRAGPGSERPVVPPKPGNAGRGKGPWFKVQRKKRRQPGDWR